MSSYEVVLDNAKLLANCFDEAPAGPFVLDLPAWHSNIGGTGDYSEVSTPDTSSYLTTGDRIGVGYYAVEDVGPKVSGTNIYMPITPDGYVLSEAHYVIIAKRSANDGAAYSPYNGFYPPPTTVPFIYCESSGVTDGTGNSSAPSEFVFNDIPVGSFGEIENAYPEVLSRLTTGGGIPANRFWMEDYRPGLGYGTATIDVAYCAIRLYYDVE